MTQPQGPVFAEPDDVAIAQETGLTESEVRERVAAGAVNTAPTDSSRSMWSILRANVFTLFNAIVGGSFLLLLVLGQWRDALFGFSALANAVIGVVQEYSSKRTLDRLAVLNAPHALVRRDGEVREIAREDVVRDDLLVLRAGDQVPADAKVLSSVGLALDESLLTGESDAVAKQPGDEVLSGSSVLAGHGTARVDKVGAESFAAKITIEARRFSLVNSEIRNALNRILKWITWLLAPVLLIVVNGQMQTAGGWALAIETGAWRQVIVGAIGAAIAMVPLGLILMTSVAFAAGAVKLARASVLAQELHAVEGLARVDVICFDKTGTLTEGVFELDDVSTPGETPTSAWQQVLAAAAADENANASATCLAERFTDTGDRMPDGAVPFSSARKWSALVYRGGADGTADAGLDGTWVLGAPEIVLSGSTDEGSAAYLEHASTLARAGKRVLLLAHAASPLSEAQQRDETLPEGLRPHVVVTLRERVRDDAADTVEYFREQGVGMRVISGDDPRTVAAVARQVGLADEDGFDARRLPEDPGELAAVMDEHHVFGRVTPDQKRRMVKALQARGHVVAMTGDGVNDVLALKDADLGIAMGNGAAATKAVSRLVLLDGKFSHLPGVVAEGRRVIANVERVSMLFLSKTAYSILVALAFGAMLWGFPFLPRQLSVLDGLTIGLPGFILALIPNVRRYMPGFLERALSFAIPGGVVVALAIVGINVVARLQGAGVAEARTASCLVLALVALWILNVLSRPLNIWRILLLVASHVGLVLVMVTPIVNEFFEFVWPGDGLIAWTLGISLAGIAAMEVHFRLHRRRHPGGHESSTLRKAELGRYPCTPRDAPSALLGERGWVVSRGAGASRSPRRPRRGRVFDVPRGGPGGAVSRGDRLARPSRRRGQ